VVHVRPDRAETADEPPGEVQQVRGSTRLEAKRQRRREGRDVTRRRAPIITESEFLARREAVNRVMVVRQQGERTQIAVLEDGILVEHYVDRASHQSLVGNVYLGRVQNVLPSMEAAFVDIGRGRNAVLYAGEVNFDASGLEGESKRIESALKSGQPVLVQVTKDPVGHKGARLTSQVSLPGRYLVYVPGGSMMGISRKLPDTERARLKQILRQVVPEGAGVIVRTAAEGASEEELAHDVARLSAQWESIERKAASASPPELLYGEPDLTIRVVRDIFNEDFSKLVVAGDQGWDMVEEYVRYVAPHLAGRLEHWAGEQDVFEHYRIDEQLAKALERKVWLPSGGSLVIDPTEAMTVIDVNTGKFTGQGGNLEETVTRNNLEAAEEIVRQLRLRDIGGIIVIDFIDMVLESNRELVLRRLLECLARDRTKHQVAEVTSLGLVQMTRKRVGSGLLEVFSQPCEYCNGRGVLISLDGASLGAQRGRRQESRAAGRARGAAGSQAASGADAAGADGGKAANGSGELARGKAGSGAVPTAQGDAMVSGNGEPASGGRRRRRAASREPGPPAGEPGAATGEAGAAASAPGAAAGEAGAAAGEYRPAAGEPRPAPTEPSPPGEPQPAVPSAATGV
jgi:ribonuclease E